MRKLEFNEKERGVSNRDGEKGGSESTKLKISRRKWSKIGYNGGKGRQQKDETKKIVNNLEGMETKGDSAREKGKENGKVSWKEGVVSEVVTLSSNSDQGKRLCSRFSDTHEWYTRKKEENLKKRRRKKAKLRIAFRTWEAVVYQKKQGELQKGYACGWS